MSKNKISLKYSSFLWACEDNSDFWKTQDFTRNNTGSFFSMKNCTWDTTVGHYVVIMAGGNGKWK